MLGNRAESQDLIDLGNRIRKRRQEIHLSQEVLAEKNRYQLQHDQQD